MQELLACLGNPRSHNVLNLGHGRRRIAADHLAGQVLDAIHERSKKANVRDGSEIAAVQIGDRIRFPSGYMATFILARHGFLDLGQKYLLFVWKPAKSTNIYVASEAYLIKDGAAFSISTVADASAYEGMPLQISKRR